MNLSIGELRKRYLDGSLTPDVLLDEVHARIDSGDPLIWIKVLDRKDTAEYASCLKGKPIEELPLYGIPFAIKDCIDLEGVPTTAGCPDYAYVSKESAHVVQRLIAAGAIPVGKTNMDQFATGLVGTRSPYGVPGNAFDSRYIPGGSSSGSAVAVARGLVSFALGTDTAGSGRVPASLNNLIGLKPSRGLLSTRGVVPACRSLDCVSVFSLTGDDAREVFQVAAGFDSGDEYSIDASLEESSEKRIIGIPRAKQLEFFGDADSAEIFGRAVDCLRDLGYRVEEIDFEPFAEAARLLYEGPWLAERYLVLEDILKERPEIVYPVTRQIIENGSKPTAADCFRAQYRLQALKRKAEQILKSLDAVMLPTNASVYTIEQVNEDPIRLNTQLGYYTNFVNLLNFSAIAVPAGFRSDKIPQGVTFFAAALADLDLIRIGSEFHHRTGLTMGTTQHRVPAPVVGENIAVNKLTPVVVCGAHMRGMPLNHQLVELGGSFFEATETSSDYRLFALEGSPSRPGLVKDNHQGAAIEVEVWQLPSENIGIFLQGIAPPLGLGRVELRDGREEIGFIAEARVLTSATEITEYRSWRAFMGSKSG